MSPEDVFHVSSHGVDGVPDNAEDMQIFPQRNMERLIAGIGPDRVPADFSSPAEDYLETPLDLTEYLIENKAATFMMRVDGDSMKDAGILDGDLLVVDRAAKPVNGSVVVVAVIGEYTVKRLRRGPDCVWLGFIGVAGIPEASRNP